MAAQLDTSTASADLPVARSPTEKDTLTSVTALARFEFEPGRGNDGTKIMMVEWQDDDQSRHKSGTWQVSWPGKKTTFAADDNPSDSTNRLYFLLPPGETVPPNITVTYQPAKDGKTAQQEKASNLQTYDTSPRPSSRDGSDRDPNALHMTVHPLPAIFTPELGATAKASGKKGVLHTIWAKRRLQVLAKEIRSESEFNLEGIALEMALAEKQWIEQNFGIAAPQPKPQAPTAGLKLDLGAVNSGVISPPLSPGIQSPRSPGGRRLTDKLKGLSIMTNEKDLANGVNTPTREVNPLSPEVGDMAVSSFSAFKGDRPTTKATTNALRRIVPISPPSEVTVDQAQSASASLAEIARGETSAQPGFGPATSNNGADAEGEGEDLFAVAMSPRSPDAPKSPFSIPSGEEIGGAPGGAFARIKGIQTK